MALCMFNLVLWFYFVILLDTGPNGLMHSTKQERDSRVLSLKTEQTKTLIGYPTHCQQNRKETPHLLSVKTEQRQKCAYMIPPAFREVGELMFQRVLQDLKQHTQHSAQPIVTQN